jgi:hypothetical protein
MITLINVFTVEPVNRAPGFMSSTLHRSVDGTKVTMYAQWRSAKDYQAMRQGSGSLPFLQEALIIARFEPSIHEIVVPGFVLRGGDALTGLVGRMSLWAARRHPAACKPFTALRVRVNARSGSTVTGWTPSRLKL